MTHRKGARMRLFVVGEVIAKTKEGFVWGFQGVFRDQKAAESRCKGKHWFVGPVYLDSTLPEENVSWPGAYFPNYEAGDGGRDG
jgi:hypothetical protein